MGLDSELLEGEDSWVDERCVGLPPLCSVGVVLFRLASMAVKLELVVIIFSALLLLMVPAKTLGGLLFDSMFCCARLLISFTRFRILFVPSFSFVCKGFSAMLDVVNKGRCNMDSQLGLLRAVILFSIEIR